MDRNGYQEMVLQGTRGVMRDRKGAVGGIERRGSKEMEWKLQSEKVTKGEREGWRERRE